MNGGERLQTDRVQDGIWNLEKILSCEGSKALAQVAQRSCGCPITGSVESQEGVPLHGQGGWNYIVSKTPFQPKYPMSQCYRKSMCYRTEVLGNLGIYHTCADVQICSVSLLSTTCIGLIVNMWVDCPKYIRNGRSMPAELHTLWFQHRVDMNLCRRHSIGISKYFMVIEQLSKKGTCGGVFTQQFILIRPFFFQSQEWIFWTLNIT